jgi:mono/diheme cytochrome c family protein
MRRLPRRGDRRRQPAAPAFASLEMRHTAGLDGRVAELARLGHYDMPPLKLSPADAHDVTAYIQSLGGP